MDQMPENDRRDPPDDDQADEIPLRRVRRKFSASMKEMVLIAVAGLLGTVVLVGVAATKDRLEADEPTTTVRSGPETPSSSDSVDPPDPVVRGTSLAKCEVPIDSEGLSWVQVESSTVKDPEWIANRAASEQGLELEFCDGTAFQKSGSALMLLPPISAEEVKRLDAASPPAALSNICSLRRAMRIEGGKQPYRAPHMDAYFSDFVIRSSDQGEATRWIGPSRCFPLLEADPEFGSRAALDRYFALLDEMNGAPADPRPLASDLAEVTTGAFMSRSGGVEAIVKSWKDCQRVRVTHVAEPRQVKGFHILAVHVDCRDSAGATSTREYELAMAPPGDGAVAWRLHWDPQHWGEMPAIS